MQHELLSMDLKSTSRFLRTWNRSHSFGSVNLRKLMRAALSIKITRRLLKHLQNTFCGQLLRERMGGCHTQWIARYGDASQNLLHNCIFDMFKVETAMNFMNDRDAVAFEKKIEAAECRLVAAELEMLLSSRQLLLSSTTLEDWCRVKNNVQSQVNAVVNALNAVQAFQLKPRLKSDSTDDVEAPERKSARSSPQAFSRIRVQITSDPGIPTAAWQKKTHDRNTEAMTSKCFYLVPGHRMRNCLDRHALSSRKDSHKDLRVFQARAAHVDRELQRAKVRHAQNLHRHLIAQAELEDAEEVKRSISSQLLELRLVLPA